MFHYKLYMFRDVSPKYEMETFQSKSSGNKKYFLELCMCVETSNSCLNASLNDFLGNLLKNWFHNKYLF